MGNKIPHLNVTGGGLRRLGADDKKLRNGDVAARLRLVGSAVGTPLDGAHDVVVDGVTWACVAPFGSYILLKNGKRYILAQADAGADQTCPYVEFEEEPLNDDHLLAQWATAIAHMLSVYP